jgi:hypothetical protein
LYSTLASFFRTTSTNLRHILVSVGSVYEYYYPPRCDSMSSDRGLPSCCRNLMPPDSGWNRKSIPLKDQYYLLRSPCMYVCIRGGP